jgi:hypothetical protein
MGDYTHPSGQRVGDFWEILFTYFIGYEQFSKLSKIIFP